MAMRDAATEQQSEKKTGTDGFLWAFVAAICFVCLGMVRRCVLGHRYPIAGSNNSRQQQGAKPAAGT